ncbi:transmembrane protein 208 homolog [Impatiens glandulifera]|uniref:transmembrane protein 208 homolog n=1 Tax=Impatiens glandulifera TaxID=253017 RepID=UPI001FB1A087|nr:transmembrane protein 208 homolog [Impatiens glandulifera]XP_047324245.1 transmembrane protein 208 homolog [Impatiens glandulifera]
MANQGAKKRKEENTRHMKNLLRFIIACNAVYLLIRAGVFHASFNWKHWVGLILTSCAYNFPYRQLASMAKPSYGDDGELFDGGYDMSTAGVCGYLHDVIYITGFVQLGSIISDKFWYIYLVIPGFAIYKVLGFAKGFLPSGSEGEEEDEKTKKKREKMERKASRGKFVKTRTR